MIAQGFDYLALGHLHRPEAIRGDTNQRYSGSPLPMGFGEAGQKKQVILIEFQYDKQPHVKEIPVEVFRELMVLKGDINSIEKDLKNLCLENRPIMVEMIFESGLVTPLIQTKLREQVENTKVDIIKIRKPPENKNHPPDLGLTLADLDEMDVFSRCLDENKIPVEVRKDLVDAYREILASVHEEDTQTS